MSMEAVLIVFVLVNVLVINNKLDDISQEIKKQKDFNHE